MLRKDSPELKWEKLLEVAERARDQSSRLTLLDVKVLLE